MILMILFLIMNGVQLVVTEEDIVATALAIATYRESGFGRQQLTEWIAQKSDPKNWIADASQISPGGR